MKQSIAASEQEIDEKRAAFEKERADFEALNKDALDRLERQGRRSFDASDECALCIPIVFCVFYNYVFPFRISSAKAKYGKTLLFSSTSYGSV